FFSSRRRHTRSKRDWSSDVCSSDLADQGLDGDLVEDAPAVGDAQPLLRFYRGLQTVGPALEVGDAAPRTVDEGDGAILNDVVDVPDEQVLGVQGDVDLDERLTGVLAVLALRI